MMRCIPIPLQSIQNRPTMVMVSSSGMILKQDPFFGMALLLGVQQRKATGAPIPRDARKVQGI